MAAGPEFDRAFLQAVIANHQAEISAIDSWKASAKDEDLKKDLSHTTSGLQSHLSKADELTKKMEKPSKPPM
jgi:predicted outer membrane protein